MQNLDIEPLTDNLDNLGSEMVKYKRMHVVYETTYELSDKLRAELMNTGCVIVQNDVEIESKITLS